MDAEQRAITFNLKGDKPIFPTASRLAVLEPQYALPDPSLVEKGLDDIDPMFHFVEAHRVDSVGRFLLPQSSVMAYKVEVLNPATHDQLGVKALGLKTIPAKKGVVDIPSAQMYIKWHEAAAKWDFTYFDGLLTIGQFLVLATANPLTRDCLPQRMSHSQMLLMGQPHNYVGIGGFFRTLPSGFNLEDSFVCPMAPSHFYNFINLYSKSLLLVGAKMSYSVDDVKQKCYYMWMSHGLVLRISPDSYGVEIFDKDYLRHLAPLLTIKHNKPVSSCKSFLAAINFKLFEKFVDMASERDMDKECVVLAPTCAWEIDFPPPLIAISAAPTSLQGMGQFELEMPEDTIFEDYRLSALLAHNVSLNPVQQKEKTDAALLDYVTARRVLSTSKTKIPHGEICEAVRDNLTQIDPNLRMEGWRKLNAVLSTRDRSYMQNMDVLGLGSQVTHRKLFSVLHAIKGLKGRGLDALDMCSGQGGFVKLLKALNYNVTFMDSDGLITNSLIDRDNVVAFPFNRIPTNISDTLHFARNLCTSSYGLVVSDGYSPTNAEKREEYEYSSVHLWQNNVEFTTCQLIVANKLTSIGGNTVIKILGTPLFEDLGASIINSIALTYERFVLIKPAGSCPSSFEFYIALMNKLSSVSDLAIGPSNCDFYCKVTALISVFAAQRRRLLNNAMGALVAKQVGKAGVGKHDPFPYYTGPGPLEAEEKMSRADPVAKTQAELNDEHNHWNEICNAVIDYEIESGIRTREAARRAAKTHCAPGGLAEREWVNRIDISNGKSFLAHVCQCACAPSPVYLGWVGPQVSKKAIAQVTLGGVVYEATGDVACPRKTAAQTSAAVALVRKLVALGVIPSSYFIRFFG